MKRIPTDLPDIYLFEPQVFVDARGFFLESYNQKALAAAGITATFVQDNHSKSQKNTLRGLHAQWRRPQGKLIRVIQGEVFDVVVDIRRQSPTFKKWAGFMLSAENFRQCYIPPGFAHGFCVLSETAEFEYKVTDYYDSEGELHLAWNDPDLGIRWPVADPILSAKDKNAKRLKELTAQLP